MRLPVYFCFLNVEFSAFSDKYIVDEEQNSKTTVLEFLGRTRGKVNLTFLRTFALY